MGCGFPSEWYLIQMHLSVELVTGVWLEFSVVTPCTQSSLCTVPTMERHVVISCHLFCAHESGVDLMSLLLLVS